MGYTKYEFNTIKYHFQYSLGFCIKYSTHPVLKLGLKTKTFGNHYSLDIDSLNTVDLKIDIKYPKLVSEINMEQISYKSLGVGFKFLPNPSMAALDLSSVREGFLGINQLRSYCFQYKPIVEIFHISFLSFF